MPSFGKCGVAVVRFFALRSLGRSYVTGVISHNYVKPSGEQCGFRPSFWHRLSTLVADIGGQKPVEVQQKLNVELTPAPFDKVVDASDPITAQELAEGIRIYENFVSEEEEKSLFDEVEPYLKRLRYETSHWDDAIHGYRETERKTWSLKNKAIIERLRAHAFPPGTPQLAFVHVLDIMASGAVHAHIDSTRFCGSTISGICLLSTAVMRFTHDKDKSRYADALVSRRCLYVMTGKARYDYAHEVLGSEKSKFKGQVVPRDRRISIICRNEP